MRIPNLVHIFLAMELPRIKLLKMLIIICMADNIILSAISYMKGLDGFLIYFILSTIAYVPAYILAVKKPFASFLIAALVVNSLMFIFDGGIWGAGKEFVYYIPIIISYYIFIPSRNKVIRAMFVFLSLGILMLSSFTSFCPNLKIELYSQIQPQLNLVAMLNLLFAVLATIVMLDYFIKTNENYQSELLEVNEKLSGAEFRWNFALTVSNDGVWDWNILSNEVFYSDKWKQQLGYGSDEISHHFTEWLKIVHPDDMVNSINTLYGYIKGETTSYECVFRLRCKDGSYRWIKDMGKIAEYDMTGKPVRMIGTHTDITEVIESQNELRKQQKIIESINQNITEGIYRSSPHDGVVFVNEAFVKMFGYSSKEELQSLGSEALYKDPLARIRMVHLIEQFGYFTNQEAELKRKDGTCFWGLLSSIKTVDSDGSVYYDGALRDITPIKQIERELIEARNKAEALLQVKNDFISMVSHELRKPLNAIQGFTEFLLMQSPRQDQMDSLGMLKFSCDNLTSLITNILEFGRLDSNLFELNYSSFSLPELVKKTIHIHQKKAQLKNIELIAKFDSNIQYNIISDPLRLGQVLNNLIGNAIKFTEQGHVMVMFETLEVDGLTALIKFTVKDTGIGIAPEHIPHIFESFKQIHGSIDRGYEGVGLGLSITQKIVESFNSEIAVTSAPNIGTEFSFSIRCEIDRTKPVLKVLNSGSKPPHTITKQKKPGIHILVVDDNNINLFVLTKYLKLNDIAYDTAGGGEEAVEKALSDAPDLVIMDIHMPEVDGIEATKRILSVNPDIPIIGLTADVNSYISEAGFFAGMRDVLFKPMNANELIRHINEYCSFGGSVGTLSKAY